MLRSQDYYEMHASICKTFGHPKRLMVLTVLREKEVTVSKLADITGIDHSNLSQHLHVLREKGVVNTRREGTKIYYKLAHPNIGKALDLMAEFLAVNINATHALVSKEQG